MGTVSQRAKEDTLSKIFNKAALQARSFNELRGLHQAQMQELIRSERGSQARCEALSNLEAISLAMAQRLSAGPHA